VVKQAAPDELVSAIQAVYRGESFLSPSVSRTVIEEYVRRAEAMTSEDSYDRLTNREREVLQLIAEGHSNRESAEILHVSVKTIESHRSKLMQKLDLDSTAEIVQYAIRKGVISSDR
jgi:DNA-binding NarL/FixJ family response regulator